MTALAKDFVRKCEEPPVNPDVVLPAAVNSEWFMGSMVAANTATGHGKAAIAEVLANAKVIGVGLSHVNNNPGAAAAKSGLVRRGIFEFKTDGTVTQAHQNLILDVIDDNTVGAPGVNVDAGVFKGFSRAGLTTHAWVEIL